MTFFIPLFIIAPVHGGVLPKWAHGSSVTYTSASLVDLNACLNAALVRDPETNLVLVREERCIACWTCTLFCPFGVIFPWPERKFALKCDRCAFMENPVCLEACPCQALELVELEDFEKILGQRRAEMGKTLVGKKEKGLLLLDLGE